MEATAMQVLGTVITVGVFAALLASAIEVALQRPPRRSIVPRHTGPWLLLAVVNFFGFHVLRLLADQVPSAFLGRALLLGGLVVLNLAWILAFLFVRGPGAKA